MIEINIESFFYKKMKLKIAIFTILFFSNLDNHVMAQGDSFSEKPMATLIEAVIKGKFDVIAGNSSWDQAKVIILSDSCHPDQAQCTVRRMLINLISTYTSSKISASQQGIDVALFEWIDSSEMVTQGRYSEKVMTRGLASSLLIGGWDNLVARAEALKIIKKVHFDGVEVENYFYREFDLVLRQRNLSLVAATQTLLSHPKSRKIFIVGGDSHFSIEKEDLNNFLYFQKMLCRNNENDNDSGNNNFDLIEILKKNNIPYLYLKTRIVSQSTLDLYESEPLKYLKEVTSQIPENPHHGPNSPLLHKLDWHAKIRAVHQELRKRAQ